MPLDFPYFSEIAGQILKKLHNKVDICPGISVPTLSKFQNFYFILGEIRPIFRAPGVSFLKCSFCTEKS